MHTTGGSLHGSKLTAGSLEEAFKNAGVHPKLMEHLHGSGFFGSLWDAVKKGTKFVLDNKDTIASVGKAGYSAYQASKKGGTLAGSGIETGGKVKKSVTKKQTPWTKLVQKIAKQEKCGVKEAIEYIKENNLYN